MSAQTTRAALSQQAMDEALRTVGTLFQLGDIIELRALHVGRTPNLTGRTHAGYFNFESGEQLRIAICKVDGKAEGVYVVLNPCNPDLLARSYNRLQAGPKNTTTDADIVEWRWLYIDADATRPAGISATDAEHKAALQRVLEIREFLQEQGWPDPVHGDSGNGGHLLYRLPALDVKTAGTLVKGCLRALAQRFSDAGVKVDESTANAARLCKLYGTMARKGDSTQERPHRRSCLIETPEKIVPVSLEMLESLASEAVSPAVPALNRDAQSQSTFDIDHWLCNSGLQIAKGPNPYNGGRKWILDECPFNIEHKGPAVIALPGGGLSYKCLHKSCADQDWKTLRGLIEPSYQDRSQSTIRTIKSGGQEALSTDPAVITELSQIPDVFAFEGKLDWCVSGMIAEGSITLLCAESGTGKTWVGYYLAASLALGTPVLGRPVKARKVLYIDGENPVYVVKQRLQDLGFSGIRDLTIWGGWCMSPPVGPDHQLVIDFAKQHKGTIVYDSLIEFHPGSEQSSTETRAFMRHFRHLASLGATVIILHHTGKAESSKQYRGSSDIKAAVDTAYLLTGSTQQQAELGELTLTCFKARLAPGQNFGMQFKKGRGFVPCEASRPAMTTLEIVTQIVEANPKSNQKYIVELARSTGSSKGQVENCLKNGSWLKEDGPNNSILYSLPRQCYSHQEAC